jgi:hypothetical protein
VALYVRFRDHLIGSLAADVGRDRSDCSGWICDGPLRDGEAKNRTLVWWLDLAEPGTAAFRHEARKSGHCAQLDTASGSTHRQLTALVGYTISTS